MNWLAGGWLDLITHAALGGLLGEALLGRRLGNRALGWGALIGVLPDAVLLLFPFLSTTGNLFLRNGPSHSLLVAVAATWLLTHWLAKLWKKDRLPKWRISVFVFVIWAGHVLLDCLTIRGGAVFWPFVPTRVAFGNLAALDVFLAGPLVVALVWLAFLRGKKQGPKRRRLCAWGLGIGTGYVGLSLLGQWSVSTGFEADLSRREALEARRMIAPMPLNILVWRAVVDRGDELWVGYRPVFRARSAPVRWTVFPRGSAAFAAVAELPEARTIDRVCDGWWIARSHRRGVWLADLRFSESGELEERRGTVDLRAADAWVLEPEADGERLRRIVSRGGAAAAGLVDRPGEGGADRRLAGIHGSLPEALEVID